MRTRSWLLLVGMLCVVFAAPALAQMPSVINPPQIVPPNTEDSLEHILQRHPELAANPSLVNNQGWQKAHPNAYAWFRHHPKAMQEMSREGAYRNGSWRNSEWWYRNDPNWVNQNHPEWVKKNPQWQQSGDWDEKHEWHSRNWWKQHRHEWVKKHHPEWANAEPEQAPPQARQKHHKHDHD